VSIQSGGPGAQELNLFCTLCTSLFALGCLVLSVINGAALLQTAAF
jgi:hypothetical protein